MKYGNDDQRDQERIERERLERRRRIQLMMMGPRQLVATYRRVSREHPSALRTTGGLPQDRTEMITAIMTMEADTVSRETERDVP